MVVHFPARAQSDTLVQTAPAPAAANAAVELTVPAGWEVVAAGQPEQPNSGGVQLTAPVDGAPVRIRLVGGEAGAPEVVVQPGQSVRLQMKVVEAVSPLPAPAAVAPTSPPRRKLPGWVGMAAGWPWALGTTLLTGAALAVVAVVWAQPANQSLGVGPAMLQVSEQQKQVVTAVSLAVAAVLSVVSLGLVALPFVLEQAEIVEPT